MILEGIRLAISWRFLTQPLERCDLTRTFGAAIGALLIVLFMAHIATRLTSPVSAATPSAATASSQR
jgi:hypothetical protein